MSAYGGYAKTGYGAQGADDAGGFFAGGSQQQSSQTAKSYQDESLRPVTIKQILDADEPWSGADFKIDDHTVTQITFIGQVRSINPQPTNITLRLDDGTGQIEVKKWTDADKQDDAGLGLEPDAHVRIFGRLKTFNGKRHVIAHVFRPVPDFNEVNYHMLEAAYVHLFYSRGALGADGRPAGAAGGGGAAAAGNEDSMFVDGGAGADALGSGRLAGCSAGARKMYRHISEVGGGGDGVHLNAVSKATGMSVRDVLTAADELYQQGLVYTTVDDETWAIFEY